MREIFAFQVLHRDVGEILFFAGVINRNDIRMTQAARRFRFAEETLFRFVQLIFLEFLGKSQGLYCNDAIDFGVSA